jgi:hypothetical protein
MRSGPGCGLLLLALLLASVFFSDGKIDISKKKTVGASTASVDALDSLRKAREITGMVAAVSAPAEAEAPVVIGPKGKAKKIPVGTAPASKAPPPPQAVWDAAPSSADATSSGDPRQQGAGEGGGGGPAGEAALRVLQSDIGDSKTKIAVVTSITKPEKASPTKAGAGSIAFAAAAAASPAASGACFPCGRADPVPAAVEFFWANDLLRANGCACLVLRSKRDDTPARIARAVFVATQKYAHSVSAAAAQAAGQGQGQGGSGAAPALDMAAFQAAPAPALVAQWEVLAPFPLGDQDIDAGT